MKQLIALSVVAVLLVGIPANADEKNKDKPERSAEEVVRDFFIAFTSKDKAGIQQTMLPNRHAAVLWQGHVPPREALAQIKAQFEKMTCRECEAGETINLPGKGKLKVTDSMVNESRKMLFPVMNGQTMPTLLPVHLVNGKWRVDASSIVNQFANAGRIRNVTQITRACLSYSENNNGNIPVNLSQVDNIPKSIDDSKYKIVAKGNIADYERHGSTVLVKEIKADDNDSYATGYLDGHADFRKQKQDHASTNRKVRAVCNACGAWVEGDGIQDEVITFSTNHLNKCGKNKQGKIISFIYSTNKKYSSLKQNKKEK